MSSSDSFEFEFGDDESFFRSCARCGKDVPAALWEGHQYICSGKLGSKHASPGNRSAFRNKRDSEEKDSIGSDKYIIEDSEGEENPVRDNKNTREEDNSVILINDSPVKDMARDSSTGNVGHHRSMQAKSQPIPAFKSFPALSETQRTSQRTSKTKSKNIRKPGDAAREMRIEIEDKVLEVNGGGNILKYMQDFGYRVSIIKSEIIQGSYTSRIFLSRKDGTEYIRERYVLARVVGEQMMNLLRTGSFIEYIAESFPRECDVMIVVFEGFLEKLKQETSGGGVSYREAVLHSLSQAEYSENEGETVHSHTHAYPIGYSSQPVDDNERYTTNYGYSKVKEAKHIQNMFKECLMRFMSHEEFSGLRIFETANSNSTADYLLQASKYISMMPYRKKSETYFSYIPQTKTSTPRRNRKKKVMDNSWKKQLMQFNTITEEKASAIVQIYKCPRALFRMYTSDMLTEKERELLLKDIEYSEGKKRIGPRLSKLIFHYYTRENGGDPVTSLV